MCEITLEYIKRNLLNTGKPKFGNITVEILQSGLGRRYQAFITTPTYTTMRETPEQMDTEGILSFIDRIYFDVWKIYREFQ